MALGIDYSLFANYPPGLLGGKKIMSVDIDFDDSYATGGKQFQASDVGLNAIEHFYVTAVTDGADEFHSAQYDAENEKIIVNDFTDALEFANAADLTGISIRALVIGY